jgi:site-specific recombinase XerC
MKFYLKKSSSDSNLIMGNIYDAQFANGRFVYSTGERIKPGSWIQPDKGSGYPKKGFESLQRRLAEISKQAYDYILVNRSSLTSEGLKQHLENLRPKEIAKAEVSKKVSTMCELWEQFLAAIKETISEPTFLSYEDSLNTFKAFLEKNKWQSITLDKFTITHYKKFQGYLKQTLPSTNTQAKKLKHFKQLLTHVAKLKFEIGFDPEEVKYKETPGLKISLSEEELQTFIDADIKDRTLDNIRDLWVIQCSVGPRISDLKRLDKNIKGNKIIIETQKARKGIEIPIPPNVRAILEKHNYALPKISEARYREGIKELYKKYFPDNTIQVREGNAYKDVPVWEEISSHDAVRTFITLSHERGMSVNSIAKITGKTVKVLLSNYLVESQKVADKEMEKAWGASPLKIAK